MKNRKYIVGHNYNHCHPETINADYYAVLGPDGNKISTFHNYENATNCADNLNKVVKVKAIMEKIGNRTIDVEKGLKKLVKLFEVKSHDHNPT